MKHVLLLALLVAASLVLCVVPGALLAVGDPQAGPTPVAEREIPRALLDRYQRAPQCRGLPWQVVAAIGYVESRRATTGGARLDEATGNLKPPIIGVALNGIRSAAGPPARGGGPEKGGCAPWIEDLAVEGECLGRSRGGLTSKIHLAVDRAGLPLSVILTPGQAGDNPWVLPLLDDIADLRVDGYGVRVGRVLADKAYTHPSTRKALRARKIKVTIPEKSDQIARRKAKGSAGGRPPAFDPDWYRERNVVERCFNRLKQFRGLATRYAKRAAYHRAEIVIACIILHLR